MAQVLEPGCRRHRRNPPRARATAQQWPGNQDAQPCRVEVADVLVAAMGTIVRSFAGRAYAPRPTSDRSPTSIKVCIAPFYRLVNNPPWQSGGPATPANPGNSPPRILSRGGHHQEG